MQWLRRWRWLGLACLSRCLRGPGLDLAHGLRSLFRSLGSGETASQRSVGNRQAAKHLPGPAKAMPRGDAAVGRLRQGVFPVRVGPVDLPSGQGQAWPGFEPSVGSMIARSNSPGSSRRYSLSTGERVREGSPAPSGPAPTRAAVGTGRSPPRPRDQNPPARGRPGRFRRPARSARRTSQPPHSVAAAGSRAFPAAPGKGP